MSPSGLVQCSRLLPRATPTASSSAFTFGFTQSRAPIHTSCSSTRRHYTAPIQFQHGSSSRRNASTDATHTSPLPTETSTPLHPTIPQPERTPLDWNTFFALRKSRRRMQLGGSITTAALGMAGGAQGIMLADMEALVSQIPLDPFMSMGLLVFACGGAGWLLGPVVGTGVFNLTNSRYRGEMIVKEKEFYDRVKRYRVDPSASSMANPVPDYYGEKVSSVQGYRQWLKDQRAFNKKRETFVK